MSGEDTPDQAWCAPLTNQEVLGAAELGRFEQTLGPSGEGLWRGLGRIPYGRPAVLPLDPDRLPDWVRTAPDVSAWRFGRLEFALTLPELGGTRVYVDATLQVRLDGETVTALALEPEGPGADDVRRLPSWIHVRARGWGGPAFEWTLSDPTNDALSAATYRVSAVLRMPNELTVLRGELRARARLRRSFLGRPRLEPTVNDRPLPFETPLPAVWPRPEPRPGITGATVAATTREPATVHRLCLAVDVESYSSRRMNGQAYVQKQLMAVLDKAAAGAGLIREDWDRQGQGDGELALLSPVPDPAGSIDEFLNALRGALAEANHWVVPEVRLRLRVALADGYVQQAANGYAGDAVIAVCRMRDSDPLRALLRDHPRANAVVAVSETVYRLLAGANLRHLRPEAFQQVPVRVKEFQDDIWTVVLPE